VAWLKHWLRTTFDYNPTFPISALLLLIGLRTLSVDGNLDAASVADTALGVGVLQAYELGLMGVALLLLWPRRIAYETTSILIILAVVRFASPFMANGMGAEGMIWEAMGLGLALGLVMTLKGEAVVRRLGLDLQRWERRYDYALYALAAVGFPLLGNRLAAWTGDALTHADARLLHLAVWWAFALLLVPMALGLRGLGRRAPLRSRVPAIVWRCLTVAGLSLLLYNALWVGGDAAPALAYFPLALLVLGLYAAIVRAASGEAPPLLIHAPAALLAAVTLLPERLLLGPVAVLPRTQAVLLFLPLAGAALPLIAPRATRQGLRSLAAVAGLTPLALAPTWLGAELYLLGLSLALAVVGVVWRRDRLVFVSAGVALLVGTHLGWRERAFSPSELALAASAALALVATLRELDGPLSVRLARGLYLGGAAWEAVHHVPGNAAVLAGLGAAASLGALAWRESDKPTGWAAGAGALALLGRRFAPRLDPGVTLILLAFAAIPLGTTVAIRRERRRAEEALADLDPDELADLDELPELTELTELTQPQRDTEPLGVSA
jgi:hypothetical protein